LQIFFNYTKVARLDEMPPGKGSLFFVDGKNVALFNVDGKIYAIADTCPHAGGSLGMGKLNGNIVTCPMHGMKFDVTNGCFAGTPDAGVSIYPVKVLNGKIMVSVPRMLRDDDCF
jgi:3-phenylpropionate/trans-cinnamate dioxygenase ferredoxin component